MSHTLYEKAVLVILSSHSKNVKYLLPNNMYVCLTKNCWYVCNGLLLYCSVVTDLDEG